jgi:hypothetical protein
MLTQIALLQTMTPYLGHPIYAYSVVLFTMIAAAGVGSVLSERVSVGAVGRVSTVPIAIAVALAILAAVAKPVLAATVGDGLAARCLVAVSLTAPVSLLLGCCFPLGVRLVSAIRDDALPWMWGVNGACSVLASIAAVGVSMWVGIGVNLALAAAAYLLLTVPTRRLAAATSAATPASTRSVEVCT